MTRSASVFLTITSVFFLVHSCQASLDGLVQSSRDDMACSPDTQPLELTEVSGWFTSPNHPALYPHQSACSWLITSRNTTVSLNFTYFYTEARYDKVLIYNGNSTSNVLLGDFSGRPSTLPTGIHSTGKQMLVVFTSDYFGAWPGFNASYISSDYVYDPDPCNRITQPLVLADSEGTFQSNGFPVVYPKMSNCQWLFISQLPDGVVRLEFDVFATYSWDWVRLYDGNNNNARLIGELSGNSTSLQKLFYSSQQFLFLQFLTANYYQDIGFNGTYMSQVRPTTTAFPPGLCGSNLHVSPSEATFPPTHDIMCQLEKVDTNYLDTYCVDLIQNLPGIGNAYELKRQGGNFGCYLTYEESYDDAQKACYDDYQWSARLGTCVACTRMYVCIRF